MKSNNLQSRWRHLPLLPAVVCAALLAACSVGPDYVRPSTPMASTFKEMKGWTEARPSDGQIPTAWWARYGDPQLDALETKVISANQSLAQAEATYRQEKALVEVARAAFFPDLSVTGAGSRAKAGTSQAVTSRSISLDATWEVDLWGRVRRAVEASQANADASGATLANTQLSLQSELAIDYFQLRGADATVELLNETVNAYQKALTLTQNQYQVGVAQLSDVVQAQTQLVSTQAMAVDIGVQRSALEHAVAVLTGAPPDQLDLASDPLTESLLVPPPPIAIPSTLLQRRPDVATAERQVVAANAEIGVAIAAYYPDLSLTAGGGVVCAGNGQPVQCAGALLVGGGLARRDPVRWWRP